MFDEQAIQCPPDNVPLPDLLEFALTYDGYFRLADADHILRVVRPVLDSIKKTGVAPKWAGLDLLRGALFLTQREFHWVDDPAGELERRMRILLEAVRSAAEGRLLTQDYLPG